MQVLASLLLNRAEKELLIVQKIHIFYVRAKILLSSIRLPCIADFLCRAIFRGCAEIEIFGDIFTSGPAARDCSLPNQPRDNFCFVHFCASYFWCFLYLRLRSNICGSQCRCVLRLVGVAPSYFTIKATHATSKCTWTSNMSHTTQCNYFHTMSKRLQIQEPDPGQRDDLLVD